MSLCGFVKCQAKRWQTPIDIHSSSAECRKVFRSGHYVPSLKAEEIIVTMSAPRQRGRQQYSEPILMASVRSAISDLFAFHILISLSSL